MKKQRLTVYIDDETAGRLAETAKHLGDTSPNNLLSIAAAELGRVPPSEFLHALARIAEDQLARKRSA